MEVSVRDDIACEMTAIDEGENIASVSHFLSVSC